MLIFGLMMAWMYTTMPSQEELEQRRQEQLERQLAEDTDEPRSQTPEDDSELSDLDEWMDPTPGALGVFSHQSYSDTVVTVVETPRIRATFTNLGGGLAGLELREHNRWDGTPVQLMSDTTRAAYSLEFLSTENYNIESDRLLFRPLTREPFISITGDEQASLVYEFETTTGSTMIFTYTVNAASYEIGLAITYEGVERYISGRSKELVWKPAIPATERDIESEAQYTSAYSLAGGVLESFQPSGNGFTESIITGNVSWVASKSKFFTQIMKSEQETDGAILSARLSTDPSNGTTIHDFNTALRVRLTDAPSYHYNLFLGPLDFYELREFDSSAYDMVDTGFRFIRWFSDPFVKYVILPFFSVVNGFIGNMGVTIILFSILIKIVLYPLTKKSFESMAAMRELQPEMEAIKEKYKDDPQKQQQATMKLFKTAKVNPLGSCLPNLLQIPVLITFWRFFQNAIEVRQEAFLWAPDLSAPDIILQLPFTIPFMGDHIAGFVLLMTASMVIQMKVSGQSSTAPNPALKMMQYVLPIMLLVIFNRLSSGLSLYYLVYNALSIAQQMMINKQMDHVKLMETVDKKKAKQMRKEQEQQKKQERQRSKKS